MTIVLTRSLSEPPFRGRTFSLTIRRTTRRTIPVVCLAVDRHPAIVPVRFCDSSSALTERWESSEHIWMHTLPDAHPLHALQAHSSASPRASKGRRERYLRPLLGPATLERVLRPEPRSRTYSTRSPLSSGTTGPSCHTWAITVVPTERWSRKNGVRSWKPNRAIVGEYLVELEMVGRHEHRSATIDVQAARSTLRSFASRLALDAERLDRGWRSADRGSAAAALRARNSSWRS